jgi:hypothetical protein
MIEMRFLLLVLFFLSGFSLNVVRHELFTAGACKGAIRESVINNANTVISGRQDESVLSSGKWLKVSTSGRGVYKIPHSLLKQWGISDPYEVNIYGTGGLPLDEKIGNSVHDDLPQLAISHGKSNGADCLFFYAPGAVNWEIVPDGDFFKHRLNPYSTKGYFFITEGEGASEIAEILPLVEQEATHAIASYNAYDLYEQEKFNLLSSGKQWFSDKFINGSTKNYNFLLHDISDPAEITISINAVAHSSAASEMIILANQNKLGEINFDRVNTSDATSLYADEQKLVLTFPVQQNELNLIVKYYSGAANANAWLDYIEINYIRKLKLHNDEPLFFRDIASVGEENIAEFSIENISSGLKVWDITDFCNVKEVSVELDGNFMKFKRPASQLREYVAFDVDGNFPEPQFEGEVENQNIHGLSTPEFLIISHPDFMNSAEELADFHRSYDGMEVAVVSAELVYNEFSSGRKDAAGIRNFIKMFYDRKEGLKYVLLFGDGSYDNKGVNTGSNCFIPTYQSDNSLNPVATFVTDDYFVILDEGETVYEGTMDLCIGRIPCSTTYQAEVVVNKIKNYNSEDALGKWRNHVCFIADDEDGGMHMTDSEKLADMLNEKHEEFVTDKIYFDAYQQVTGPGGENYPDVTDAINRKVREGVLVLNYMGHANERFMSDEKVLDVSHINSWSNADKLPIFVTATCGFSRFDGDETSAGEYVLFNPDGGGIGLFSTTRLVYAYSNYLLSRSFYNFVFEEDENGEHYRMGEIMRLAKVNTAGSINKRNFSLLADPALKLSYPRYKVVTNNINGKDASGRIDTLGALQHVTVSGFISDISGKKADNFSGEIIPTVYDKAVMIKTLGNAGEMPVEFKVQENIIYKGLVNVTDGEFTFSFVIPKDISYNPGRGKIVYYADNGTIDANGGYIDFAVGGSGSQVVDNEGPEIELYLNTPDFVSGDKVEKNCSLLAFLSDENGINIVGSGIGHDITAIIDDNLPELIVLNDYYQSNEDDFTSGTVVFPLRDLSAGKHSLRIKAWDVANNSSEKEIEFEVTDNFYISEVRNSPNPVYDYTFFIFRHNQPDASLNAIYEIFDLNGRRVDYFTTVVGSSGLESNRVRWDLNASDSELENGIYLYRITVKNNDGVITSSTGKMVVAR